jgi:hypothetical protein
MVVLVVVAQLRLEEQLAAQPRLLVKVTPEVQELKAAFRRPTAVVVVVVQTQSVLMVLLWVLLVQVALVVHLL